MAIKATMVGPWQLFRRFGAYYASPRSHVRETIVRQSQKHIRIHPRPLGVYAYKPLMTQSG